MRHKLGMHEYTNERRETRTKQVVLVSHLQMQFIDTISVLYPGIKEGFKTRKIHPCLGNLTEFDEA